MKKYISFIILLLFVGTHLKAQNLKRGFGHLEKAEYEKAYERFNKDLFEGPENPGTNFGLAMLFANPTFSKHDIIKSWEHCKITQKNISKLSSDDREIIAEYFANTEARRSSWPVKKKIDKAIDEVEEQMIKYIREENQLDIANTIIEKFPDFKYYDNVIHIRNHIEYQEAKKKNTTLAYMEFMKKYADAAQIPHALNKYRALLYEEVAAKNTIADYNDFIQKYPDAKEVNRAIMARNKRAFEVAKQANTIRAHEAFIGDYPDALEVPQSEKIINQLIYERAKQIKTIEAFNEFIQKYPEGEQFIDIFNLKSEELGRIFLNRNSEIAKYSEWVKLYDNNKLNEFAGDLSFTGNDNIIISGTTSENDSSLYNDAWVLGLSKTGVMNWKKQVGEYYNEQIHSMTLNADNELFYTGTSNFITDSVKGEAWLYKLGSWGEKLWKRRLNHDVANKVLVDENGDIYICGYDMPNDSTIKHFILKLNDEGKKLWTRTYSGQGNAFDMKFDNDQNIVVAAGSWIYKMDQQGYLIWENLSERGDSLMTFGFNAMGVIAAGIKDSTTLVVKQFDTNGNAVMTKYNEGMSAGSFVRDMVVLPNNKLLLSGKFKESSQLAICDSQGNVQNVINVTSDPDLPVRLKVNSAGEVFLLTANHDLLLIKLNTSTLQ